MIDAAPLVCGCQGLGPDKARELGAVGHVAQFLGLSFKQQCSVLFLPSLNPVPVDAEGTTVH